MSDKLPKERRGADREAEAKTEFVVGDRVWFLRDNTVTNGVVVALHISEDAKVAGVKRINERGYPESSCEIDKNFSHIALSKEGLINKIFGGG